MAGQSRNVEGVSAWLKIECNQSDQRNESADAKVDCYLPGGIGSSVASSPQANHDERGHESEFVEEIEEEEVERCKCAQNTAGHHEQQDVKFFLTGFDFPGGAGGGEGDDGGH